MSNENSERERECRPEKENTMSETELSPAEVLRRELARGTCAWCGIMGCREQENAAAAMVDWIASNGNEWATLFDLENVADLMREPDTLLIHHHEGEPGVIPEPCVFPDWLVINKRGKFRACAELVRKLQRGAV